MAALIFQIESILFAFLALFAYPLKERKDTVQRIARMVITTISSTSVKPFLFFLSIVF